jgi:hypothetical protein
MSDSESSSSSTSIGPHETVTSGRTRRQNAGNRMEQVLAELEGVNKPQQGDINPYATMYGGFDEDDNDKVCIYPY